VFQPWIITGEQPGLLTHIAATESVSLCVQMKKLTAFIELESVISHSLLTRCNGAVGCGDALRGRTS
jgi:hypothetical protein